MESCPIKSSKKAKVDIIYTRVGFGGKTCVTKIYSDVKEMTEASLLQKIYKDYPSGKFSIEVKSIVWM